MATIPRKKIVPVDKAMIRRVLDEVNARMGFVPDPTATAQRTRERIREQMLAKGIRPEDCHFSRGIVEMREE